MALNNFRFNVVLRIGGITLVICLVAAILYKTTWAITPVVLSFIGCLLIAELVRYVERSNRQFSDFLLSIKSAEFSSFDDQEKRGHSFTALKKAFNTITTEFQKTRIEKEAHYTFLQSVMENLGTAVISFDSDGNIKLINDAAKDLLGISFLSNINYLEQINPAIHKAILSGSNEIITNSNNEERQKLLLRTSNFRLQDLDHKLVLITNIRSEIESTEIEAWEQLLHVLTHEIMNSITPISSLSGTIKSQLNNFISGDKINRDTLSDISEGLQVISKRSAGLINFVNQYKTLLTLPQPNIETITVASMLERVQLLVQTGLGEKGIKLKNELRNKKLHVRADINLIEQVLINLVNNAADSLNSINEPVIILSADHQNEKIVLRISDNGEGIDKEILSKIFIPFFTTKKNGTGIGLSLSKQVMRLHNGGIYANSVPGEGTTFSLEFPSSRTED
jgi:two-component system, NtrC family, nitrogen regulation sensor histidine kinase NtrY